MTIKAQPRKQGADGRLYFTYNLGAEYLLHPPVGAAFGYRIIECEFEELTETEYYKIESAGKELSARFSVNQLKIMLGKFECEQTEEGKLVELPLLLDEIKTYFGAKLGELKKANVKENDKIKGTDYNKNLKDIKTISERLEYLTTCGDEAEAIKLQKKYAGLLEAQQKIVEEKGVDIRILRKIPDCPICCDTGLIDGEVCECVPPLSDKIKAYNAARRLSRQSDMLGNR